MIRHILSMHVTSWARALELPRTLDELAAQTRAGGPAAGASGSPGQVASRPPAVSLTFDDGPHPDGTPKMLEVLAAAGASATFFLVGEQVVKRPELARQILDSGHAIGLHGFMHRPHPLRKPEELAEDFTRGLAAVEDATGATPHLHRPPFGIYSATSLRMARERELQPLLWSRWGKDWRKLTTPEQITKRVTDGVTAGDVILLHDADFYSARCSHRRTAAALPEILRMLKSAGLDTVTFA
jgi:peptidoglycan/xylan/chitin deacetylase (PgdA/CDA1 family)